MGFFDKLMEWFGGTGAGGDNALYYYVKCDHCDEVVRLRIGRGSDLTQEFDGAGDSISGYSVNKEVVGSTCFRRKSVSLTFNRSLREESRNITGGDFVEEPDYEEYVESKAAAERASAGEQQE